MKKLFYSTALLLVSSWGIAQTPAPKEVGKFFATPSATSLKKGINQKKVAKITDPTLKETASLMAQENYPLADRYRSYECYLSPQTLSKKIKTGSYSQFENPTGIYFKDGETAVIWVGETQGAKVELTVADFTGQRARTKKYPLSEGWNQFKVEHQGNSYFSYYNAEQSSAHKIDAHILSGSVNGVFDISKDNNQRYMQLLANAASPIMDVLGKQVQLAYSVESLKRESPDNGVELVQLYDSLIRHQHTIMGLVKYNRVPKNRMFGRTMWSGFMHADGWGAAFHENTMTELANVNKLRRNSWGVAHEFGHVNQVRPTMTWVGTTEVTNNIYSVWSQYYYNTNAPKLEREELKDYDGRKIGGRITAYMESAFVHRQPWLTQAGNDRWDRQRPRDWGGDHFVKLVPLWQLQLYFAVSGKGQSWGNPDFYGDIFIKAIDAPETPGVKNAAYQLAFIRNACDVAKLDLTDFFEYSCMLFPIDLWVDDYTCAQMTITPQEIADMKTYASKYPKPQTPVLHYITANSVEQYHKNLSVSGTKGKGFTQHEKKIVVNNKAWKNAVAFETFSGEKLVKVAFVGAGSKNAQNTIVHLPEGTTSVKAVGADGTRIDVL